MVWKWRECGVRGMQCRSTLRQHSEGVKTQESIKTQDCTCETHKVLQRTAVHSARTLLGCTPLNGALRWNLGIHALAGLIQRLNLTQR